MPTSESDRLLEMFQHQESLEEKYSTIEQDNGFYYPVVPIDLDDKHDQMALRENNQFIVEELFEAMNLLKNKPWKQTAVHVDAAKFIEEMADATHFILKAWLFLFGTAEAAADHFHREYLGKAEVNKQRQEKKY